MVLAVDGYVRIPELALGRIDMHHVSSAIDLSIAPPEDVIDPDVVTGYTEWAGEWERQTVSIGWDWAVIDGRLKLLSAAEIRTNILLLGADGSSKTAAASIAALAKWIEHLPWRTTAIPQLLQQQGNGSV